VWHGPAPVDHAALRVWLDAGCRGPAPVRQGFVAALVRPDGSLLAASGSRWEQSLFYAVADGRLLLATHPRELVRALPRPPALDVAKLVDLVALYDAPESTVFEGVRRLPLGHLLERAPGRPPSVRRWFAPDPTEDRGISPHEAPILMREAVRSAVEASLPAIGDVGATLSGGLDSTMVVATASGLLAPAGRGIHAMTHVPLPGAPQPAGSWEPDDGPYAEEVARSLSGVSWAPVVNTDRTPPLESCRWAIERAWYPTFNPPNQEWCNQIIRDAEDRALPLLLTGASGNATFSREKDGIVRGLLQRGRVAALLRQVRLRAEADGALLPAARSVVRETLPRQVLAWRREQRRRRLGAALPPAPDVAELPVRREALSEDARADLAILAQEFPPAGRTMWLDFARLDTSRHGFPQNLSDSVWWSDPLSDPEVVALALRLPEDAWLAGGRDRGLAREAADGLVPDRVRLRRTHGGQSADVDQWVVGQEPAYRALLDRFRDSPSVPRFLDVDRLAAAVGPELTNPETASVWQDIHGRAFAVGQFAVWYEDEVLGG
jgi:asparagine synthase (glutamine-hydrolysing)